MIYFQKYIVIHLMRAIRPFHIVLNQTKMALNFCTLGQVMKGIRSQIKEHNSFYGNYEQFRRYFNDQSMLKLVVDNYCFNDLIRVSCHLLQNINDEPISQSKIIFLTYCHNLYSNSINRDKEIFEVVINSITDKIKNGSYSFASAQIERMYVNNIKRIAMRDSSLKQQHYELKTQYFKFICLKHGITNKNELTGITGQTLLKMYSIIAYLPREDKEKPYIDRIQKLYLEVVDYQISNIINQRDQQIQNCLKNNLSRITHLMEIGVNLSKLQDRYSKITTKLPTQLKTQQQFIAFLEIIRELFTFQAVKRMEYKQFDQFNSQLSRRNKHYQSPRAKRAFESYVQALISMNLYNLKVFSEYFEDKSYPVYHNTNSRANIEK